MSGSAGFLDALIPRSCCQPAGSVVEAAMSRELFFKDELSQLVSLADAEFISAGKNIDECCKRLAKRDLRQYRRLLSLLLLAYCSTSDVHKRLYDSEVPLSDLSRSLGK